MRLLRAFSIISFTILLAAGGVSAALCQQSAETAAHIISSTPDVAVASQYDTVHVYIAPQDFDGFVSKVLERWCGREDLNLHTLTGTCTSSMRVCQFLHDRKHRTRSN